LLFASRLKYHVGMMPYIGMVVAKNADAVRLSTGLNRFKPMWAKYECREAMMRLARDICVESWARLVVLA